MGVSGELRVRIDIVTIFPSFFDVLDLSLIGKARESGVIDLRVQDLRDHAHDQAIAPSTTRRTAAGPAW